MEQNGNVMQAVADVVREVFGADPQGCEALAGDLGTRRFLRVRLPGGRPASCVARVEAREDPGSRPPGVAPEPGLEPLRTLLEEAGLPVPLRYGGDPGRGVDLLQDLGDECLRDALDRASDSERRNLYRQACALVPQLQSIRDPSPGVPAFRRHLDRRLLHYKRDLFLRWSLPVGLGRSPTDGEKDAVGEAFEAVVEAVERAPARLAHRDFQSRNLHFRCEPDGRRQLVMIDFQGAFLAPPEYDLVCLLRDASAPLPELEMEQLREEARPQLPDAPEPEDFVRRFDLLTLSRNAKDHARFLSAASLRGATGHLRFVPAAFHHLREAARRAAHGDPRVRPFLDLLDTLRETPCER